MAAVEHLVEEIRKLDPQQKKESLSSGISSYPDQ